MKQAPVFDEIYKNYLTEVSAIDLSLAGKRLGMATFDAANFNRETQLKGEQNGKSNKR